MDIGRLAEVDIRELWDHEQYGFSSWIAEPENMDILSETLGIDICDIKKEENVGSFRCDIVGREETSDDVVIIENQLEASDHNHLGKIITYASGLDASIIIWIVKEAREEHRSAIEWLNNNTPSEISFFLIEIHAYRIDNSSPAPKFEMVEKPNDFIKNAKRQSSSDELNRSQGERLEFWNRFNDFLMENGKPFNIRKATSRQYYHVAIGVTGTYISLGLINREGHVRISLVTNDKDVYDGLNDEKNEIEKEIGHGLEWQRQDDRKKSRIAYRIEGLDFDDKTNYPELMDEMMNMAIRFVDVFAKRARRLKTEK